MFSQGIFHSIQGLIMCLGITSRLLGGTLFAHFTPFNILLAAVFVLGSVIVTINFSVAQVVHSRLLLCCINSFTLLNPLYVDFNRCFVASAV